MIQNLPSLAIVVVETVLKDVISSLHHIQHWNISALVGFIEEEKIYLSKRWILFAQIRGSKIRNERTRCCCFSCEVGVFRPVGLFTPETLAAFVLEGSWFLQVVQPNHERTQVWIESNQTNQSNSIYFPKNLPWSEPHYFLGFIDWGTANFTRPGKLRPISWSLRLLTRSFSRLEAVLSSKNTDIAVFEAFPLFVWPGMIFTLNLLKELKNDVIT